jgi:alkanesulfonate monooxygenase SsuD/methylene tetrahydromethanopterin reductase-like flavin-dependent oxidoreductase (luciferase family)
MRVGIGLPTTLPDIDGRGILRWARRAEAGPFSSLGVLDRIPYPSLDPFASLAAAAAVTERIGLVTMVAIGPIRSAALLAKQAASVDAVSGGRLTLGLALGARLDDYAAAGADPRNRGRVLDEHLMAVKDAWEEARIVPRGRAGGPPVLVGGLSGSSFARMARSSDGYVHGGGPPRAFASAAARARAAWVDLGRPGRPQLWGQAYFALGPEAQAPGEAYLRDYYAFTGPFAERIVAANLTSPQLVIDLIRGYEEAGCDELVLLPTATGLDQVERLGEVLVTAGVAAVDR